MAGKKKDDKKKYKEDGDLEEAGKVGAGKLGVAIHMHIYMLLTCC